MLGQADADSTTLDELAAARLAHPEARILAGGTDVGLWVTKQLRDLPPLIYTGEVAALRELRPVRYGKTERSEGGVDAIR